MSALSRFLKENKTVKKNGKYAPTVTLQDEKGSPLEWEFRHITSKENDELREECTKDVPVQGKPNLYRAKFNTGAYLVKLVVKSTVVPDLYDAGLQDSYGVKRPEDLVYALVDDPGEYQDLCVWLQEFQGFSTTLEDRVKKAKN